MCPPASVNPRQSGRVSADLLQVTARRDRLARQHLELWRQMMRSLRLRSSTSMVPSARWSWLEALGLTPRRAPQHRKGDREALARRLAVIITSHIGCGTEVRLDPRTSRRNGMKTAGSKPIGESSSSTEQWKDIPRGTWSGDRMIRLDLPNATAGKAAQKIVPHSSSKCAGGRALTTIPKRSTSPRSTSTLSWIPSGRRFTGKRPI